MAYYGCDQQPWHVLFPQIFPPLRLPTHHRLPKRLDCCPSSPLQSAPSLSVPFAFACFSGPSAFRVASLLLCPPPLSLVYGQATRGDLRPLVVRGWGVSMSQPLCRRDRVTSSRDICPGGTSQDPKPNRHKAPPFTPGVDQKLAGEAGPTTAVLPTPGTAASTCTTCWLPLPPSAPYIL